MVCVFQVLEHERNFFQTVVWTSLFGGEKISQILHYMSQGLSQSADKEVITFPYHTISFEVFHFIFYKLQTEKHLNEKCASGVTPDQVQSDKT